MQVYYFKNFKELSNLRLFNLEIMFLKKSRLNITQNKLQPEFTGSYKTVCNCNGKAYQQYYDWVDNLTSNNLFKLTSKSLTNNNNYLNSWKYFEIKFCQFYLNFIENVMDTHQLFIILLIN